MVSEKFRRVTHAIRDLSRINRAFLTSSEFRAVAQQGLIAMDSGRPPSRRQLAERDAAPPSATPYLGLTPVSGALTAVRVDAPFPRLNLVLPDYEPGAVFAGVHTAVGAAAALGRTLGLPIRVVVLSEARRADDAAAIVADLATRTDGAPSEVALRPDMVSLTSHPADVWVVTHWTTAHAALVACRAGVIDHNRIVYLVQDYEPGFVPMSTDRALASATYREGFHLVVNSTPVADALRRHEGVEIEPGMTFAPGLDLTRLAAIAARREASRPRRVLFYGRPSKPRNMFALGVSALRVAAGRSTEPVEWVSAGEPHDDVDLGGGQTLRSLGTLSWDAYFHELEAAGAVLSLQASPHPSHPPLEAALSGAIAVTNEVDGTRTQMLPNVRAVLPDPRLLGEAVVAALAMPGESTSDLSALGLPLSDVIKNVANRLTM